MTKSIHCGSVLNGGKPTHLSGKRGAPPMGSLMIIAGLMLPAFVWPLLAPLGEPANGLDAFWESAGWPALMTDTLRWLATGK